MTTSFTPNRLQSLSELPPEQALQGAATFLARLVKEPEFLETWVVPLLEEADKAEHWYVAHRHDDDVSYSLQIFVWPPGTGTKIHDHSSWGAFCCVVGSLSEERYERLDEGSLTDHARLKKVWHLTWSKEDGISTILPYDGGIHRIGNPGDRMAISVHLYGPRMGQLDGRDYDPSQDSVCDRQEIRWPISERDRGRRSPIPFPSRKAKVAQRIQDIMSAVQNKAVDRLESYHLFGPKFTKTLSENFPVSLEQRRIPPRMGLPPSPFSKGDAPYGKGYHNAENGLLPDAQAIVEETQEIPAQAKEERKRQRRQAQSLREGGRRGPNRYVLWTGCQWKALHRDWFGVSSSVVHERFQRWRGAGIFEKLRRRIVEYYARERGGIGWKWQAMDSKHSPAPLGGEKVGNNPTDRGKLGAKINLLLVDERGAPLSVVLTGANRHDKVSAVDLIVSMIPKRQAHKEQHLCADKAYDSEDLREFAASAGYIAHIKVNSRTKGGENPTEDDSPSKIHPARRWVVERTISWLTKRRSVRTRWAKKAENWLALVQLACAHILLNLAVFG